LGGEADDEGVDVPTPPLAPAESEDPATSPAPRTLHATLTDPATWTRPSPAGPEIESGAPAGTTPGTAARTTTGAGAGTAAAGAAAGEVPGAVAAGTFEELYRRDFGRMVRVAHLLMGSSEAAEDVVQDAFVQLYARFATVGDSSGYLYRSVVNGCRGRHRHRRVVERLRPLTAQPAAVTTEIDETWGALRRLSPRRRAVVVLRFYADLPLAEIADILDCRVGTVKSMLHRAMADLREVVDR
jgi:RNA polymerase sigma factor (sigma-70 family)